MKRETADKKGEPATHSDLDVIDPFFIGRLLFQISLQIWLTKNQLIEKKEVEWTLQRLLIKKKFS